MGNAGPSDSDQINLHMDDSALFAATFCSKYCRPFAHIFICFLPGKKFRSTVADSGKKCRV